MLEDYYQTFGISRNANEQQIKKSFRKLAFTYHPDHSKLPNTQERFTEIQKAYDILMNPYARSIYDEALKAQENQEIHQPVSTSRQKAQEHNIQGEYNYLTLKLGWAFFMVIMTVGFVFPVFSYVAVALLDQTLGVVIPLDVEQNPFLYGFFYGLNFLLGTVVSLTAKAPFRVNLGSVLIILGGTGLSKLVADAYVHYNYVNLLIIFSVLAAYLVVLGLIRQYGSTLIAKE